MREIIKSAVREFELLEHRSSDKDCYDSNHPVDRNLPYVYLHWGIHDVLRAPHTALSLLFIEGYSSTVPYKLGDCSLRVIRNLEPWKRGFGKHVDIDFQTKIIGSVFSDGSVALHEGGHYGLQAQKMGVAKATPHVFNPLGATYDIVFFTNLHYSVKFPDGTTVGEYLTNNCYHKDL